MKVILLQDVKGTGNKDQVVEVSEGFARNYLLPRKLAAEANATALNAIETSKLAARHREEKKKAEAEAAALRLKGKIVTIAARAGEAGKLYGSITTAEIADALQKQHGVAIDKHKIELEEPIRKVGQAQITVRLSAGVASRMIVNVVTGE